jgi:hypothetical protein
MKYDEFEMETVHSLRPLLSLDIMSRMPRMNFPSELTCAGCNLLLPRV